jgi:hypothetical protein
MTSRLSMIDHNISILPIKLSELMRNYDNLMSYQEVLIREIINETTNLIRSEIELHRVKRRDRRRRYRNNKRNNL